MKWERNLSNSEFGMGVERKPNGHSWREAGKQLPESLAVGFQNSSAGRCAESFRRSLNS